MFGSSSTTSTRRGWEPFEDIPQLCSETLEFPECRLWVRRELFDDARSLVALHHGLCLRQADPVLLADDLDRLDYVARVERLLRFRRDADARLRLRDPEVAVELAH